MNGLEAHGICLLWFPGLITLFVGSDVLIGASYVSISTTLILLVYHARRSIPFQWVFMAFGAFIVLCGIGHFVDILTLWMPVYWLSGTVRLLTAIASVTTAMALPWQFPKVFALIKNNEELKEAHRILDQEATSQNKPLTVLAQELIRASRMQRNFVAIASHETRTALAGIQGLSELMREGGSSPEEVKEYSADIFSESERLSRMINDLLDLEKMRSGRVEMKPERVDLNALIKKVVNHSRKTSKHTFRLRLDTTLPNCVCDSDKIEQVLTNLLSNALKYSPPEEEIAVGSRVEQGMAQMWVLDHGIGVPPESREEIFAPYSRVGEQTRYIQGTGLGLSISREIMRAHGGRIWVESAGESKGSIFYFTVPLAN